MPAYMLPENQQKLQAEKDKVVLIWAAEHAVGTKPATFAEQSRAPQKSKKNVKR
jgi:hypothetical protein